MLRFLIIVSSRLDSLRHRVIGLIELFIGVADWLKIYVSPAMRLRIVNTDIMY